MPSLFVSHSLNIRLSALTQAGFRTCSQKISVDLTCEIKELRGLLSHKVGQLDAALPFEQNKILLIRSRASGPNIRRMSLLPKPSTFSAKITYQPEREP
jgi:hypothetical protein